MLKKVCFLGIFITFALTDLINAQTWIQVNDDGFKDVNNSETLYINEFKGSMYVGVSNDYGCEVWRTAGVGGPPFKDWVQVNTDGFTDANNMIAQYITEYNGSLYVGTTNESTGGELWKTDGVGGPPFTDWVQVNQDGFGDKDNNVTATGLAVYDGNLYVGSGHENTATGCRVWKTGGVGGPPFTDWVQVNQNGFGDPNNLGAVIMVEYVNSLHVGTYNEATGTEIWSMKQPLMATPTTISANAGGTVNFTLDAEAGKANRIYLLLGSISGTNPGTPLPGGSVTLPLNWDIFTNIVVDLINTPIFSNFMGKLNGTGSANAIFDTLAPISGTAGLTMHFAFALNNPWDFVSNPVGIEIVP